MNDLPEPVEHPPYHESQDLMMLLDPNAPTIPLPEVTYFTATADHLRPSKPHLVLARWLNHRVSLPVWLLALALIFLLAGAVPILRANPLTQGHSTPSSAARMSTTTSSPARGIHIPQWTTVQTFTGYGNANTTPLTITVAAWNIVWSCRSPSAR